MFFKLKYYLKNRGTGVNKYSTLNQSVWTLIKEFFHPELKNERYSLYWASRIRGSGY